MSMMCRPKWPFLYMYGSHDTRHVDFRGLTGSQRTPRVWGVTEAVWINKFITELGMVPSIVHPILLYCDNNGAIAQAKEPRSHQRFKHDSGDTT